MYPLFRGEGGGAKTLNLKNYASPLFTLTSWCWSIQKFLSEIYGRSMLAAEKPNRFLKYFQLQLFTNLSMTHRGHHLPDIMEKSAHHRLGISAISAQ